MGTYLATGIVHKMSLSRKEVENLQVPLQNIIQALQKEVNLDCYTFEENDSTLSWKIKPEMLEGNFAEFLQVQFKMYDEKASMDDVLNQVRQAKTGREIIELAKSCTLCDFQMIDNIINSLDVLRTNGFLGHATIYYELMAFFIDGKIIMECYGNILHYFEQAIRLQMPKYPVVACLKTMITS